MTLYMNNQGSKWKDTDKRNMKFALLDGEGLYSLHTADYFFSFGNFGGVGFRYKGKRYEGLPREFYDIPEGLLKQGVRIVIDMTKGCRVCSRNKATNNSKEIN